MTDSIAWFWAWHVKERARRLHERMDRWIAWHLPRSLVLWCAVRLVAAVTSGKQYGDTVVAELTFMDALHRWDS